MATNKELLMLLYRDIQEAYEKERSSIVLENVKHRTKHKEPKYLDVHFECLKRLKVQYRKTHRTLEYIIYKEYEKEAKIKQQLNALIGTEKGNRRQMSIYDIEGVAV